MTLSIAAEIVLHYTDKREASIGVQQDSGQLPFEQEFADGDGLGECDVIWKSRRTLNAASEELDLVGGLSDAFGVAFSFAKLKGVIIHNRSTTAGDILTIGGATAAVPLFSAANDSQPLGPDATFLKLEPSLAGIAVTGGATDKLKLDSGAFNIEFDIILFGVKA
jgi:hypothetical protein